MAVTKSKVYTQIPTAIFLGDHRDSVDLGFALWALRFAHDQSWGKNMKDVLFIAATLALFVVSAIAAADPVYLQCTSFNKHSNKTTTYTITLDENAQTATFSDDDFTNGKAYTVPAQFTQVDVRYSWKLLSPGFAFNYRIDRTNMDFSRRFMSDETKTDYGNCKIAEPVKRQF